VKSGGGGLSMEGGFQPHLDFDETRRIGLVLFFGVFALVFRGFARG
jgi:hypothetical protein